MDSYYIPESPTVIATRKRELEATVDFMSREERERMIQKLSELNEEEEALVTATGVEEEHHTGELGQMNGVEGFLIKLYSD